MTNKASQYSLVSIKELKAGMIIMAYTGFNDRFRPMDETACKFIKHNFAKSKAVISRDGNELDIPVEEIDDGDTLNRLYGLPASLNKLTMVNDKLAAALKRRGFRKFQVKQRGLKKKR